jgi:hypothetical protein
LHHVPQGSDFTRGETLQERTSKATFPNGRWGVSRSAAFGEIETYYLIAKKASFNLDELKKLWGE